MDASVAQSPNSYYAPVKTRRQQQRFSSEFSLLSMSPSGPEHQFAAMQRDAGNGGTVGGRSRRHRTCPTWTLGVKFAVMHNATSPTAAW
jgi:hypothetical protein